MVLLSSNLQGQVKSVSFFFVTLPRPVGWMLCLWSLHCINAVIVAATRRLTNVSRYQVKPRTVTRGDFTDCTKIGLLV
ncbi:hypothetical protein F5Y16DRAFT_355204 [Xylariaceae sp. FL0255]|nr:hypothetical protein F5Y16DRAFT_355204 [Xylariaceae sp. FL0255]